MIFEVFISICLSLYLSMYLSINLLNYLSFRRMNGSIEAVDEFRRNLTRLKPELENLMEFGGTKVSKK